MSKVKFYRDAEASVPTGLAHAGKMYFTDQRNIYVLDASGAKVKMTDVEFAVNEAALISLSPKFRNKIYVAIAEATMWHYDGSSLQQLGGSGGGGGTTWYTGAGAPAGGLGANGDFYLDSANGDFFLKTGGVWDPQGSLKGATGAAGSAGSPGAPGSVWFSGSGAPAGGTGINGDYYLNTANGDVYTKSGGSWGSPIDNLTGPAGASGSGSGDMSAATYDPAGIGQQLVGISATQTLTNKTLTAPVINSPTGIVKGDVGLGNVDNTSDATKNSATATLTNKTLTAPVINSPTGITKANVGLSNVDNTSDATKNSATATLTNKTLTAPVINSPTGMVKGDVGLGNVDNTSDATKNSATATLTNKRITMRVQTVASAGTVTPHADNDDCVTITAQAAALTLANPAGTPTSMQPITIRIKDNGTARAITYGSQYRAVGITLPTTTVINKTMYLGMVYNEAATKWDVVGYGIEA